jgi:hypothetical protein
VKLVDLSAFAAVSPPSDKISAIVKPVRNFRLTPGSKFLFIAAPITTALRAATISISFTGECFVSMRGFMIFSLLFGNATRASRTAQEKGEILEVLLRMSALKEWRIRSQSEKVGLTRESGQIPA